MRDGPASRAPVADLRVRPLAVTGRAARRIGGGPVTLAAMHRAGAELDTPGDVVWMSPPGAGLLPVHVIVGACDLARVADAATRTARPRIAFDLAGVRRIDWRLGPVDALPRNASKVAALLERLLAGRDTGLGEPAATFASRGSRWFAAFDPQAPDDEAVGCLRALVGRGGGSTPAGDDAIVGALAYAWAAGGDTTALARRVRMLASSLDQLTTSASATYLRAALDGSFGSHLHALARTLGRVDERRWRRHAMRVAAHGASSGIDTLAGFLAAARAFPGQRGDDPG